jgi:hypothetical protein
MTFIGGSCTQVRMSITVHYSTLFSSTVYSIASHSPTPFHISLTLHVYNSLLNYRHYEAAVARPG